MDKPIIVTPVKRWTPFCGNPKCPMCNGEHAKELRRKMKESFERDADRFSGSIISLKEEK